MGCRWFPSLENVWRSVPERHMAQYRTFAARCLLTMSASCEVEELAKQIVCGKQVPKGSLKAA